jgi:hypothetical protein
MNFNKSTIISLQGKEVTDEVIKMFEEHCTNRYPEYTNIHCLNDEFEKIYPGYFRTLEVDFCSLILSKYAYDDQLTISLIENFGNIVCEDESILPGNFIFEYEGIIYNAKVVDSRRWYQVEVL